MKNIVNHEKQIEKCSNYQHIHGSGFNWSDLHISDGLFKIRDQEFTFELTNLEWFQIRHWTDTN